MYQVVWLQTALDELAAAWTNANSSIHQEITLAAQELDRQLQSTPETRGESRAKGRRIVFHRSYAVVFVCPSVWDHLRASCAASSRRPSSQIPGLPHILKELTNRRTPLRKSYSIILSRSYSKSSRNTSSSG
jgi:hypothetical protein